MNEIERQLQLQNEMLLVLIKYNDEIFNELDEDLLDYFTEEVLKNSTKPLFKEECGGIFKDSVHCTYCGSAKHLIINAFNPRAEREYRVWFCKNCHTKVKEYLDDGSVEEYREGES
mgnify:CR=1 FL=1